MYERTTGFFMEYALLENKHRCVTWFTSCEYYTPRYMTLQLGDLPSKDSMQMIEIQLKNDGVIRWKRFRVTGPLWGEFTCDRWITLTKASDVELWYFLWSTPEQKLNSHSRLWWFETHWRPLWRHCNKNRETNGCSHAIKCNLRGISAAAAEATIKF